MPMYHSWGSQNAWLRQIISHNRLYMNVRTAAKLGLADDDWAWITSHHGRVKAQIRTMEGVNPRHRVDLERDRQARRRLEPRYGRAGSDQRASCSTT